MSENRVVKSYSIEPAAVAILEAGAAREGRTISDYLNRLIINSQPKEIRNGKTKQKRSR